MKSLVALIPLAVLAATSSLTSQQVALTEHFSSGVFPPTSWSLQQNGLSLGWEDGAIGGAPETAFHNDYSAGAGGTNDNLLESPSFDLSGFTGTYLHFENRVRWANFMAHHPNSMGDGASSVEVSVDGGVSWTSIWSEARNVDGVEDTILDLSSYAGQTSVKLGYRYIGNFAHEWTIDDISVDDSPLAPPPPGVFWNVNLPTSFAGLPFSEDFDTAAGVVQPYMAITAVNPSTGLPDPNAWCNIGQMGAITQTAYSGAYALEMGLLPTAAGGIYVRNALVIGLDNTTAQLSNLKLSLQAADYGEELDQIDGIWISLDGANWYDLVGWAGAGSSAWAAMNNIALGAAPVNTTGSFYLMFAQEDNFPFGNQDGIGVDDIVVGGDLPPNPMLSTVGSCPGFVIFSADGCTPDGEVGFGWSFAGGTSAVPSGPCVGTVTALDAPSLVGVSVASGFGVANWISSVPAAACGAVLIQAIDLSSCTTSPILAL
jgi:hypothetical protein